MARKLLKWFRGKLDRNFQWFEAQWPHRGTRSIKFAFTREREVN